MLQVFESNDYSPQRMFIDVTMIVHIQARHIPYVHVPGCAIPSQPATALG